VLENEWLIYLCLSSYSPRCCSYGEGGHYGTNSDEYLIPTEREPALLCDLPVKFTVSACPLSREISSVTASTSNRVGF
jgi:hypothetical protein